MTPDEQSSIKLSIGSIVRYVPYFLREDAEQEAWVGAVDAERRFVDNRGGTEALGLYGFSLRCMLGA